jgi:hypothetical protein
MVGLQYIDFPWSWDREESDKQQTKANSRAAFQICTTLLLHAHNLDVPLVELTV